MPSIDERVVALSFENAKFEAAVSQTMATLQKLNDSLAKVGSTTGFSDIDKAASKVTLQGPMSVLDKLKARLGLVGADAGNGFSEIERAGSKLSLLNPMTALDKLRSKLSTVGSGAAEGFAEVERASGKVSLAGMTSAIDSVNAHFSTMQAAAAVALGNIASMAAQRGAQLAKSLTLGPIIQGFQEYSTNLNSIQTILANVQASGAGLNDVNKALLSLNKYSDQTIYNFSQMAKNIGTFTAAGVDLDTATGSIKGIANLAALSGSSADQAATAMYQLSQAISAGRVSLQDWNSVVNAGMGGTVFQRALVTNAENMGKLSDGAVKLSGKMKNVTVNGQSFRESIMAKPGETSWLTSDVLTRTLQQFTGDLSDAQLKAQGFNDAQIKSIQQTAKTAKAAATEVKTISQVFDVAKETIGSGWSATFQNIFGDFGESKKLFTSLSNTVNGFINANSNARNKVLEDWKALGGRKDLIQGIKNAFTALFSVLKPIKDAFREIFPKQTGAQLADLTEKFKNFAASLTLSPATADDLKRIFAGLFAVLHIGVSIVGNVIRVIADLLGVVGKGSGGFLNFTGGIGDFLVAVDKALTKGGALKGFFNGLAAVIKTPIQLLGLLSDKISTLFDGGDSKNAESFGNGLSRIANAAGPLGGVLRTLAAAWDHLVNILQKAKQIITPWIDQVVNSFSNFSNLLANAFQTMNFDSVFSAIQTGLVGGIFFTIRKALKEGIGVDFGGGVLKNLNETFSALTGNLKAMQKNIQANTLLQIGAAIALLAGSVKLMSTVDPKALERAMTAIAVGLGQLVGALALLAKVSKGGAFLTLPILAASMVTLSFALVILAGAVKIFSTMNWEELAKGLVGVGGTLAAVGLGVKAIGPGLLPAALGIIPLAVGLNILALAVKQFGSMDTASLAKGLLAVGVALTGIGLAMDFMPASIVLTGPALIAVAFAMNLLASAVGSFGQMDLATLGKGILGISVALVAIGIAVSAIPPTVAIQAAGLTVLAVALTGIAGAIGIMGGLNISTLVKGIASLAAILVVLAVGLTAMSGTLAGSTALLMAAGAFLVLAPAIALLGNLKISTIAKGLGAIAATLGVLAIAGAVASGPLSALGIALLPLAGVLIVTATAVFIFSKAVAALGANGVKAIGVMVAALTAFTIAIPNMIVNFLKGIADVIQQLVKILPPILTGLGKMFDQIVQFVAAEAPKLAVAIGIFLDAFISAITDNTPKILQAGVTLILNFLGAIDNNIGAIVGRAASLISNFLTALAAHMPEIVASGATLLVKFIEGVATNIGKVVASAANVVVSFLSGIASQLPKLIASAAHLISVFVLEMAKHLGDAATLGIRAVLKFLEGVADNLPKVVDAGVRLVIKFISGIARAAVKLADAAASTLIEFLNAMAAVIRRREPELINAGYNIASAIIDGMVQGFKQLAWRAVQSIEDIVTSLPKKALHLLGISSPSKVFMDIGRNTMLGLAQGLQDDAPVNAVTSNTNRLISATKDAMAKVPSLLDGMVDFEPTITPILDLSAVKKEATKLGDITKVTPITATVSAEQASAISVEKQAPDVQDAQAAKTGPSFSFEQNNYSPESLTHVEIYRQTKNQLSLVKQSLGLV